MLDHSKKARLKEFNGLIGMQILAKEVSTTKSIYSWDKGLVDIYQENNEQGKKSSLNYYCL